LKARSNDPKEIPGERGAGEQSDLLFPRRSKLLGTRTTTWTDNRAVLCFVWRCHGLLLARPSSMPSQVVDLMLYCARPATHLSAVPACCCCGCSDGTLVDRKANGEVTEDADGNVNLSAPSASSIPTAQRRCGRSVPIKAQNHILLKCGR
jgi:hypothetical protein